ncbi:MAG: hypothetical protein JF609_10140 [Verrucomicrobia bacterium]|nr:hypothetical protein [Verrucomicrobiota bacterium]
MTTTPGFNPPTGMVNGGNSAAHKVNALKTKARWQKRFIYAWERFWMLPVENPQLNHLIGFPVNLTVYSTDSITPLRFSGLGGPPFKAVQS